MPGSDDVFGEDPAQAEFEAEVLRHRDALHERISDYMDEAGIGAAYAAQLLIDLMIGMRMTAYGLGVEKPSAAGLKLDLDRLKAEVNEFLREAKKSAEEYIAQVKDARAEADADAEEVDE
jgi:hypothetical protein